jgi:hypothetical protein
MQLAIFQVLNSIRDWLIGQIGTVVYFLLMVLYFALSMYMIVTILRFRSRTGLDASINFFGRSLQATLAIGVVLVVLTLILGFLAIIAFLASMGGGGSIFSILAVYTIGGFATALFSSDLYVILFIAGLALVLLLITGEVMKMLFHVGYGWGLLGLVLTIGLGILVAFILEQFGIQLFALFQSWGAALESLVQGLVTPV